MRSHRLAPGSPKGSGEPVDIPMDDQVFMLPWYLPKEIYLAVRSVLPNIHIAKMRYYFDDYGCIRCERTDVLYKTNGLCEQCNAIVRWRLTTCLKKRLQSVGVIDSNGSSGRMETGLKLAREQVLKPFRAAEGALNGNKRSHRKPKHG